MTPDNEHGKYHPDEEKELKVIQQVMNKLQFQIYEDDVVRDDEADLLSVIKTEMKNYAELLSKFSEDKVIDSGERAMMSEYRKRIIEKAYQLAREDKVISEDERAIINLLIKNLV